MQGRGPWAKYSPLHTHRYPLLPAPPCHYLQCKHVQRHQRRGPGVLLLEGRRGGHQKRFPHQSACGEEKERGGVVKRTSGRERGAWERGAEGETPILGGQHPNPVHTSNDTKSQRPPTESSSHTHRRGCAQNPNSPTEACRPNVASLSFLPIRFTLVVHTPGSHSPTAACSPKVANPIPNRFTVVVRSSVAASPDASTTPPLESRLERRSTPSARNVEMKESSTAPRAKYLEIMSRAEAPRLMPP